MKPNFENHSQYGFTLIELLITLLLGAIISAAVIQVFVTSQRADRLQNSGSEIQSASIFGLQSMEKQIRLANLGNQGTPINELTLNAGVVFTSDDDGVVQDADGNDQAALVNVIGLNNGSALADDYMTRGGGISNTDVASDQLTIQYTNDINQTLFDCEGAQIDTDDVVIQRYFLSNSSGSLDLRCDAGRVVTVTQPAEGSLVQDKTINDFGDGNDGVVLIENVDQFNIRLGLQRVQLDRSTGRTTYDYIDMTPQEYHDLGFVNKPYITSIRIGIIARSDSNSPETSGSVYKIFGTDQTLTVPDDSSRYLRRVFESNILLRNARIVNI